MKYTCLCLLFGLSMKGYLAYAQAPDWQQRVDYRMEVSLDSHTHILRGDQQLDYYNNSPDTLYRLYYHLYFNAFRPGSMMDLRSRSIEDPDPRVRDRILHLKEEEMGYQRVMSLSQEGRALDFRVEGTVLEVELKVPLPPGEQTALEMEFEARVPLQVRRSGRDNAEGIAYSMSQWYPKLAEYDHRGWHATPYVGREFHGVWGNFDVTIEMDSSFTVAATGVLRRPRLVDQPEGEPSTAGRRKWRWVAEKVHDFVWAADRDYVHDSLTVSGGRVLHFFYKEELQDQWKEMQPYAQKAFAYLEQHCGRYPYPQYSIIQGGDGGMEYPMATLITGNRSLSSLVNVMVHEMAHSWYQGLLATNESLDAWMDEGFTTYITAFCMADLFPEEGAEGQLPLAREYMSYKHIVSQAKEEPMATMADHFQTNMAYGVATYSKGAVFQHQLSYVVGEEAFRRGLLRYFDRWKYKHPSPSDYIRLMERESGLTLDWYESYFVHSTHQIDYAIESVESTQEGKALRVTLARVAAMPMPVDLVLTHRDGSQSVYYIPLRIMWGNKKKEDDRPRYVMSPWPWTHPYYSFDIDEPLENVQRIEIDPSGRLADLVAENQFYPFSDQRPAREGPAFSLDLSIEGKVLGKE